MDWMKEQVDLLKTVVDVLESLAIPYMLTGSMAMMYYAEPRYTRDLDFIVDIGVGHAVGICAQFGEDFYVDDEMIRDAVRTRTSFNVIELETMMKTDLIVRKDTEYRRLEFQRRQKVPFHGAHVWMVSAEDLLLSKMAWSLEGDSAYQMRDVKNLARSVVTMDWAYVEKWAPVLNVADLLEEARK